MRLLVILVSLCFTSRPLVAVEVQIGDRRFTIPDGFKLELVASPKLTQRPIVVDFDEQGRLYVAESSGSNDNVQKQLEDRTHSILRLEDSDGDGTFDTRTVFADSMMFPEGAMWHDGSLFVAAPPSIWKLTDTDGDGVADQREEWFDGKTLTGCANDLHGPYNGPDGWIYWCKGAFAEQTYERPGRDAFVTRAAHIFRRRPEGGPIEPVMTGGMDNPVEVAFTAGGERIFTTTFFQYPANGQRDGLVHAVYGGVYGKKHGVVDGHPRTGPLMPVMTHLGAAAPSGLLRLESNSLGFKNQLLTACFNLHTVTRHELVPNGSTFTTRDHDLVTCDDLDFHPTDVIEDADGSVLIIDTGGWYKLCCPSSQLEKPDVFGAIYRLSRVDMPRIEDPYGRRIDWKHATPQELCRFLGDERPAVRRRATFVMGQLGHTSVSQLAMLLETAGSAEVRTDAVWTLCRIDDPAARAQTRSALSDSDETVRQAAAHAVSVWRDANAIDELKKLLRSDSLPNRRVAAEALGRIGLSDVVPSLLAAVEAKSDRVLGHSLIYALIESNAADEVRSAIASSDSQVRRATLLALHHMPDGSLTKAELCSALGSRELEIREIATKIAAEHPEWGRAFAEVLQAQLQQRTDKDTQPFARRLSRLANSEPIQELIRTLLDSDTADMTLRLALLGNLTNSSFSSEQWSEMLGNLLGRRETRLVSATVRCLTPRSKSQQRHALLNKRLAAVAKSKAFDREVRLSAMQDLNQVNAELFAFAVECLGPDHATSVRGLAATAISKFKLTQNQFFELADALPTVGALELSRLLNVFETESDPELGSRIFDALKKCPSAASLPPERIAAMASKFGEAVSESAKALYASAAVDPMEQLKRLDKLSAELPAGDVRRGQQVFHSEKAACFACHAMGYRGGTVGPDLTRVARVRSRRDLLEAVLYPSASFVRSYEPVSLLTVDGESITGTINDQLPTHIVLQLNATEQRRIATSDIEQMLPGKVSVMPAGLDKQLTAQQLADLLSFLESRK